MGQLDTKNAVLMRSRLPRCFIRHFEGVLVCYTEFHRRDKSEQYLMVNQMETVTHKLQ